ncbi:hypothetical protein A3H75_01245 [Candidatus Uhrbacteria bacterium RIFCSPLOWO2_02_FULL_51_9]|uniref:Antitoxin, RHH family protein n=1 Tax=Candidatus Uhrbacteria bacterium RIFCSPLOWO2_02_FULL_51_9 TaxID=1802410 RepID=A0A1F7VG48_9BACT|nr:MAG: hypothetical protein A3H75_01245 [Candidatus Uhrbacteria bacterium RIFCSPLOWO2_02_FULL_51_9]
MPTLKTRINVSLPRAVDIMLARLAKRDDVPRATKALDLMKLALEIEEDTLWDARAAQRDTRGARFVSHKNAWR